MTEQTRAKSPSNSTSSGHCEQNLWSVCTCFFVHRARRPASRRSLQFDYLEIKLHIALIFYCQIKKYLDKKTALIEQ